jgi:hypothetical protein
MASSEWVRSTVIGEVFLSLVEVGVEADCADMDAEHYSRRDSPPSQIARVLILEPRKSQRGHLL